MYIYIIYIYIYNGVYLPIYGNETHFRISTLRSFFLENYFMLLKLLIWRLSSKLLIAIPVHSVLYEATLGKIYAAKVY